jgi:hypothetical protein
MVNLSDIITGTQTVELIEPRDHTGVYLSHLRLLLTDRDTGHMQVLAIEADAFIEPRVAPMLAISVEDVDEPGFSNETGEWVDDGQSPVVNEAEPDFGYRVAIDGTETDTRLVEGGLF